MSSMLSSSRQDAIDILGRLGPLSIEAKKRNVGKRSKLEKEKDERKKPQEIREEDVMRSENETTKNVSTVCASRFLRFVL